MKKNEKEVTTHFVIIPLSTCLYLNWHEEPRDRLNVELLKKNAVFPKLISWLAWNKNKILSTNINSKDKEKNYQRSSKTERRIAFASSPMQEKRLKDETKRNH